MFCWHEGISRMGIFFSSRISKLIDNLWGLLRV
jgi:hypothetical protein